MRKYIIALSREIIPYLMGLIILIAANMSNIYAIEIQQDSKKGLSQTQSV